MKLRMNEPSVKEQIKDRRIFLACCMLWFFLSGVEYAIVLPTGWGIIGPHLDMWTGHLISFFSVCQIIPLIKFTFIWIVLALRPSILVL